MATTKSMKIQAEIDKVKAKISEQQARLKELEQKKKDGGTLGQSVPKSEEEKKEEN